MVQKQKCLNFIFIKKIKEEKTKQLCNGEAA